MRWSIAPTDEFVGVWIPRGRGRSFARLALGRYNHCNLALTTGRLRPRAPGAANAFRLPPHLADRQDSSDGVMYNQFGHGSQQASVEAVERMVGPVSHV